MIEQNITMHNSRSTVVVCGGSQGLIYGPLLYNKYVSDLYVQQFMGSHYS